MQRHEPTEFRDLHPQIAAYLIVNYLYDDEASRILTEMTISAQAEILSRAARLIPPFQEDADAVAKEYALQRFGHSERKGSPSGLMTAAAFLRRTDMMTAADILMLVEAEDPETGEALREHLFFFEDFLLASREILHDVLSLADRETVLLALHPRYSANDPLYRAFREAAAGIPALASWLEDEELFRPCLPARLADIAAAHGTLRDLLAGKMELLPEALKRKLDA